MTLEQLLVVQDHDSAIDRLTHRRATLPERDAIGMIDDERTFLDNERVGFAEQRHGIDREQKRLEDEVALVADRHKSETDRLYAGTVTAHKDLQVIQDELVALEDRQRSIEDQVLAQMEAGEPLDDKLATIDSQLGDVAERRAAATASLQANEAEIDTEIAAKQDNRNDVASTIDSALLEHYEAARAACGGIGVARLVDKTCEGCHLQLSAVEFDRIRKEQSDALIWHDCGRILVH